MRIQGVLGNSISDELGHETVSPSFDASITFGDVTLTRMRDGRWMVNTFHGGVDLAQLEGAVQWAKHAPTPLPEPAPAVETDMPQGIVDEARDLFTEQGGFGATVGGGGPIVSADWGTIDVEDVRAMVLQVSLSDLTKVCETACSDKDTAGTDILEMALEERVAKMLRDAGNSYGCFHSSNNEVRHLTYERAKAESIDDGCGLPSRAVWTAQHGQLVNGVEYLEDVQTYLHRRRTEPYTVGEWSAWRAQSVSSRAAHAAQRAAWEREEDALAEGDDDTAEWPDSP
ncbi:MAG TPA: hypothetical protein VGY48_15330 [Vicinamibacterales bacterium]|jgi:hypothetical protein|nr:hypothetical protein [Vicinamibacterales bacterium]